MPCRPAGDSLRRVPRCGPASRRAVAQHRRFYFVGSLGGCLPWSRERAGRRGRPTCAGRCPHRSLPVEPAAAVRGDGRSVGSLSRPPMGCARAILPVLRSQTPSAVGLGTGRGRFRASIGSRLPQPPATASARRRRAVVRPSAGRTRDPGRGDDTPSDGAVLTLGPRAFVWPGGDNPSSPFVAHLFHRGGRNPLPGRSWKRHPAPRVLVPLVGQRRGLGRVKKRPPKKHPVPLRTKDIDASRVGPPCLVRGGRPASDQHDSRQRISWLSPR